MIVAPFKMRRECCGVLLSSDFSCFSLAQMSFGPMTKIIFVLVSSLLVIRD